MSRGTRWTHVVIAVTYLRWLNRIALLKPEGVAVLWRRWASLWGLVRRV
jgi:hypothetical protein